MKQAIWFFAIVFSVCFFLVSCRASRQEAEKTHSHTKTSSQVKHTYRDTIFFAPAASTTLTLSKSELSPLDTTPRVYVQKNAHASTHVKVTPTGITVRASCDSLAIAAKIKSEFQMIETSSDKSQERQIQKHSGYTFFQLASMFIIGLVAGLIIGFLISKFT